MRGLSELEKLYGKSKSTTKIIGLPLMKLNTVFQFTDGKKRRLVHIEHRNMAVDFLRFDDNTDLFTADVYDTIIFRKKDLGEKK